MEKAEEKVGESTQPALKESENAPVVQNEETKTVQVEAQAAEPDIVPNKISKIKKDVQTGPRKVGDYQMSKFSRENHNRHRSERLIDRYLIKSEREESIKRLEKLQLIQNLYLKTRKQFEEEIALERKAKEEERRKEIQERREKYKNMNHYSALYKIAKHLSNPSKYSK